MLRMKEGKKEGISFESHPHYPTLHHLHPRWNSPSRSRLPAWSQSPRRSHWGGYSGFPVPRAGFWSSPGETATGLRISGRNHPQSALHEANFGILKDHVNGCIPITITISGKQRRWKCAFGATEGDRRDVVGGHRWIFPWSKFVVTSIPLFDQTKAKGHRSFAKTTKMLIESPPGISLHCLWWS